MLRGASALPCSKALLVVAECLHSPRTKGGESGNAMPWKGTDINNGYCTKAMAKPTTPPAVPVSLL
jgi:hypothetical protein